IMGGGDRTDMTEKGNYREQFFKTVDSVDTHAKVNEYHAAMEEPARKSGKVALLSVGWDPGMFSLNRMFGECILAEGETYSFWGKGLSQGHSDAVRRVSGVKKGVQYTLPSEDAMLRVRNGEQPELTTREKHVRECFVVLEDGADEEEVRNSIVTMPDYFEPFDTTVNFIDEATFAAEHSDMPHGGFVIRSGETGNQNKQTIEYSLTLGSNPEFTASVLVAYTRAVHKMAGMGEVGAKTVFDVAPGLLSPKSPSQLRKDLL
ncbi:MAG: diaminopimelate dehydrogenase, partial [Alteromonadaceae bacterium]|nr:diaminopimelate dehydrogenase [Alteromonadaceae bacterium]